MPALQLQVHETSAKMMSLAAVRQERSVTNKVLVKAASDYARVITDQHSGIAAILLAGSLARGDYWPGTFGGKVDLIVVCYPGSGLLPELVLGPDTEPYIPYHCVDHDGISYQVAWYEGIDGPWFFAQDDARKFSLLESRVLVQDQGWWNSYLAGIATEKERDLVAKKEGALGYAGYLLSDYKVDRWLRRGEASQLHANLDLAMDQALQALYYHNDSYAPAADRRVYYTQDLAKLPLRWPEVWSEARRQDPVSLADYERRMSVFQKDLLGWLSDT